MKTCSKCKIEKSIDDFYNHKSTKDGKSTQCKKCMSEYRQKNAKYAREYAREYVEKNRDWVNKKGRDYHRYLEVPRKVLMQCKNRALRKNIPFNLTLEDIFVPEICPLLEVPFIIGTLNNYEYTHSIDRIDNAKGYVKGNIQIISKKANSMKNNATKEELITFAKNILKFYNIK